MSFKTVLSILRMILSNETRKRTIGARRCRYWTNLHSKKEQLQCRWINLSKGCNMMNYINISIYFFGMLYLCTGENKFQAYIHPKNNTILCGIKYRNLPVAYLTKTALLSYKVWVPNATVLLWAVIKSQESMCASCLPTYTKLLNLKFHNCNTHLYSMAKKKLSVK